MKLTLYMTFWSWTLISQTLQGHSKEVKGYIIREVEGSEAWDLSLYTTGPKMNLHNKFSQSNFLFLTNKLIGLNLFC